MEGWKRGLFWVTCVVLMVNLGLVVLKNITLFQGLIIFVFVSLALGVVFNTIIRVQALNPDSYPSYAKGLSLPSVLELICSVTAHISEVPIKIERCRIVNFGKGKKPLTAELGYDFVDKDHFKTAMVRVRDGMEVIRITFRRHHRKWCQCYTAGGNNLKFQPSELNVGRLGDWDFLVLDTYNKVLATNERGEALAGDEVASAAGVAVEKEDVAATQPKTLETAVKTMKAIFQYDETGGVQTVEVTGTERPSLIKGNGRDFQIFMDPKP